MVEAIMANLANILVGALATWIFTKFKQQSRTNDALKRGLQALLRDRLIQGYNHYVVENKWIPIYAKESLNTCYTAYEVLGENHVIADIMEAINKLPNYPIKQEGDNGAE